MLLFLFLFLLLWVNNKNVIAGIFIKIPVFLEVYMISINNVELTISGKKILDFKNEKIDIKDGSKVAILGENGAGKTTLINLLLGNIKNYKGIVENNFKSNDIGIVFQENQYGDLIKVKELIKLIFPKWKNKDLERFLSRYYLKELKNTYIHKLSVGERQRLTLGLVLTQRKKLYIFDEMTSGLDTYKREALLELMHQSTMKSTVINITHYFEEVENWADHILILKHGKILYSGRTDSLLNRFSNYFLFKIDSVKNIDSRWDNKRLLDNGKIYFVKGVEEEKNFIAYLNSNSIKHSAITPGIYSSYLLIYKGVN